MEAAHAFRLGGQHGQDGEQVRTVPEIDIDRRQLTGLCRDLVPSSSALPRTLQDVYHPAVTLPIVRLKALDGHLSGQGSSHQRIRG